MPDFTVTADDFVLAPGEWLQIAGPSGFGKSTFLRAIMGLAPLSGELRLSGERVDQKPLHERRFGVVFQDQVLFPHLNAMENALFGLRIRGKVTDRDRARAEEGFRALGILDRARAPIDELSGGERQRLALLRAVLFGPVLLLLDEPYKGIDPAQIDRMQEFLTSFLHASPVPVIWVSHLTDTGRSGMRLQGENVNGKRHFRLHHS
jgi:ABC-type Fe3+/spermidine/putrescine transport system ATPase subunit